jgi:hypothetical protein
MHVHCQYFKNQQINSNFKFGRFSFFCTKLQENKIGHRGCKYLSNELKKHSYLKSINLSCLVLKKNLILACLLNAEGMEYLASVLTTNKIIETLNIGRIH